MPARASPAVRHATTRYAEDVLGGKITAGSLVRLACQRHIRDLETGHKRGLVFSVDAADHVLAFARYCVHTKGEWAGQHFEPGPWECFVLGAGFGWQWAEGGRRFRLLYLEVARKNGKTFLAAVIGLYGLTVAGEWGAHVYSAATKRDQAKLVFAQAKHIVRLSPALRSWYRDGRIELYTNAIQVPGSLSHFIPLGRDANTLDGLDVFLALIDELHKHKTRDVFDVLDSATGARREPMIVVITTAGDDPTSICGELHQHSRLVLQGDLEDDSHFAYIAAIDPPEDDDSKGDQWDDPAVWIKANPNLGVSVKEADLKRILARAQASPAAQQSFKKLRCNLWVGSVTQYLPMDRWKACRRDYTIEAMRGRAAWGGLDLSSKVDLAAYVLALPPGEDEFWRLWAWLFMPEDMMLEAEQRDRVPYRAWAELGYLTPTPGEIIDYGVIFETILESAEVAILQEIWVDPWNAGGIESELIDAGFKVTDIPQGMKRMSGPTKDFHALVKARRMLHPGNPVLSWNMANLAVKQDTKDNVMPDKQKSIKRIDGAVGSILGVGAAMSSVRGEEEAEAGLAVL